MKDLKDRFIFTWLYGGFWFKLLIAIAVISFFISVTWVDLDRIIAAWLGFFAYIISSTGALFLMYRDIL